MVLGMNLQTFTLVHVLISLAGIASGLVVMYGFLTNKRLEGWTLVFLTTTALTSLTGFLFPFKGMTPAIMLGIISLPVLAIAIVTRYPLHLAWRKTYVTTACVALYFNVFVLVVQSFEKIPGLRAIAPTQKEPPFAIAQIAVLVLFVAMTALAASIFLRYCKRFDMGIELTPLSSPIGADLFLSDNLAALRSLGPAHVLRHQC